MKWMKLIVNIYIELLDMMVEVVVLQSIVLFLDGVNIMDLNVGMEKL